MNSGANMENVSKKTHLFLIPLVTWHQTFHCWWITTYFYLAKGSVKSALFHRNGLFTLSVEKK